MTVRTLEAFAVENEAAARILKSDLSSAQAAAQITALGFKISAPTVRQWRRQRELNKDSLASLSTVGVLGDTVVGVRFGARPGSGNGRHLTPAGTRRGSGVRSRAGRRARLADRGHRAARYVR